jgi:uncharacterized membrane protein YhhN
LKTQLYLIAVLVVVVPILIRAEILKIRRQMTILKPIATLLVIAVAALSFIEPVYNPLFSNIILIGLLLSFGGDIAFLFQEKRKPFMIGLALFLSAHVAYTIVFTLMGSFNRWDLLSAAVLIAVSLGFYRMIAPNLGSMKVPVIIYTVIISLMVNRAIAAFASPAFSTVQAWMISLGALLFYISDLILAAGRFWRPWKYNRISLAFYYSGQLLIALAGSYFI